MKRTCWALVILFSLCSISIAGELMEYTIKGGQDSLRTEIHLKAGDCVQIKASGTIKMGLVTGWSGPEGSSLKWIVRKTSKFPAGALIGAVVGENGGADYFLVGTDAGLEARKTGRLTFFINESILADNSGRFDISVDRLHLKSLTNKVTMFIESLD